MIRIVILLLVFSVSIQFTNAQEKFKSTFLDSINNVMAEEEPALEKFNHLNEMLLKQNIREGAVMDSLPVMKLYKIAQELQNDSLLAIAYNWIGSYFFIRKGDNVLGLEYYNKAIPLAEKFDDPRRISSLYFDAALVYFALGNFEEAVAQNRKGFQNLPPKSHPLYDFMMCQYLDIMGRYFLATNKPDSTLKYISELTEISRRNNFISYYVICLVESGAAYGLLGKINQADSCFQEVQQMEELWVSVDQAPVFYNYYITYLINSGQITKAKNNAYQLLRLGFDINNNNLKLASSRYLREIHESESRMDSAYYYSRMEAKISDLIFSQSNNSKIQAFAFDVQLRQIEESREQEALRSQIRQWVLVSGLAVLLLVAFILFRSNQQRQKANKVLETTLNNLKSTQTQLVQAEKMASLGELTAGIAHEIQNPLNFVNNFSEINEELIDELNQELAIGNRQSAEEIARTIKENQQKINEHGKRADGIVKSMLQHSRTSSGQKELTDINALCDEYLRLSYHGYRAKDKSFNAKFETDFEATLPKANVVSQDIGRVILNLINNAFFAVSDRSNNQQRISNNDSYQPQVTVSTKSIGNKIEIRITDNGNGISDSIKDKIFQPFFTTKQTGQGTGLGLSLSYDIVKTHGGSINFVSTMNGNTEFLIEIPLR